jgi:hypothetical protein
MILEILLSALLLCGTQAQQGFDMSDEDFESYIKIHDDFRQKHGEAFGKGCVAGAVSGAARGFQALCIGCVVTGAANIAQDIAFPPKNEKADNAYKK